MTAISETELLARCRAGAPGAFAALYERHKAQAYALALSMTGRRDLAEDVTQQAFLRVHRSLGDFREDARFGTWLHRIVANLCIDLQRKESRGEHVPLEEVAPAALRARERSDAGLIAQQQATRLQAALASLPPATREAILMKYFSDMSYEEIALAQASNKGSVGSRIHRGLRELRERLRGMDEHD